VKTKHKVVTRMSRRLSLLAAVTGAGMLSLVGAAAAQAANPCVVTGSTVTAATTSFNSCFSSAVSAGGSQTIVLDSTVKPAISVPEELTAGLSLTITSTHSDQDNGTPAHAIPTISGGSMVADSQGNTDYDFFQVDSGASLTLEGVYLTGMEQSATGGAPVDVLPGGSASIYNSQFSNDNGAAAVMIQSGATGLIVNSTISADGGTGVQDAGTATLLNDTITGNGGYGLDNPGTATVQNTILAKQNTAAGSQGDCSNPIGTATDNLYSTTSCGGTASTVTLASPASKGGPTTVIAPSGTAFTNANAVATGCPLDDQRFFPRNGTCTVGSYQASATIETSAALQADCGQQSNPSQVFVTTPALGQKMQTVISTSPTGFGPYALEGESGGTTTGNGSIAMQAFPSVHQAAFTVTNTRPDPGHAIWSFTLTDWAGVSASCS
jgi:hypothetical protein